MIVLVVFLGGALGAPSRYLLDSYLKSRFLRPFPLGTLIVNVAGCFILGMVATSFAAGNLSAGAEALLGTGFCGGLTTFSTFSVETVELVRGRQPAQAVLYLLLSTACGLGAAALGYAVV